MNPDLYKYAARLIVLFTAMPFHECAHAFISYKLGDPTAKMQGRLSLNPLKHLDLMGSVFLVFAGFGWAKPVPVDPRYYKNPKTGMALSSLAGPVSNLLLAFVSMIFYKFALYGYYANPSQGLYYVTLILSTMVITNVVLAIFNLIPVPPFDGSRVFGLILPEKAYWSIMRYERYILGGVFILLIGARFIPALSNAIYGPLNAIENGVLSALGWLTGFVDPLAIRLFGLA